MRAARHYNGQLKRAQKLTLGTATTSVAGSALLDVVAPYLLATIIGLLAYTTTFEGFIEPLVLYLVCIGLGCFLSPLRMQLRRFIHDTGEAGLLDRIESLILLRPYLSRRTHRTSVIAAIEKYFSTWDRYVVVIFDQLASLVVGLGGLLVLLLFQAPILVLPVLIMTVLTLVYARKVGKAVSSKWSIYTKQATEEYSLIADQASNSHVRWVLRALVDARQEVGTARSAALRAYAEGMRHYQSAMVFISKGFQVSTVVMGVVGATVLGVPIDAVLLLVVGGIGLSGSMGNIFSINDMLSTALVEAEVWTNMLPDTEEPLGPKLPATTPAIVEFRGEKGAVVIHRDIRDDETGVITAVVDVAIPDMVLAPRSSSDIQSLEDSRRPGNLWWIKGPKGCGKSSLSEALCGLHRFSDGSITIGGLSVSEYDVRDYVINGPQSFDSLRRPASMLFGGDDPDRLTLKQVLHWVGYPDASLDRPLDTYSGGQKESLFRAGLFYEACQAADKDPDASGILLIDEPTNHLDPVSINAMLSGITELAYRMPNRLVLVNSHCTDMERIVRPENIVDLGMKM